MTLFFIQKSYPNICKTQKLFLSYRYKIKIISITSKTYKTMQTMTMTDKRADRIFVQLFNYLFNDRDFTNLFLAFHYSGMQGWAEEATEIAQSVVDDIKEKGSKSVWVTDNKMFAYLDVHPTPKSLMIIDIESLYGDTKVRYENK